MPDTQTASNCLLRQRDGHHARVTYEELFFDLVYVFAVTQISHMLLRRLTLLGIVQTLVTWFAVWLGWQYAAWITNWFDPQKTTIRMVIFASMFAALVMAASIPEAYEGRGLIFVVSYCAMQVGRTGLILFLLPADHELVPNFRRMLFWLCVAAIFWICGAFAEPSLRLAFWVVAVSCEYISPMFGFSVPGFGRSRTSDWTIEGGHMAERCQLFVIVALGEAVMASGATLAEAEHWNVSIWYGLCTTFLGGLAMWWLYFGTSSNDATKAITISEDPGRFGAYLNYVHVVLVLGIIVAAVGNDILMSYTHEAMSVGNSAAIVAGPAIYLAGSALYKKIVYDVVPVSHVAGALVLLPLIPLGATISLMLAGWCAAFILLGVGAWEAAAKRCVRLDSERAARL